uniref:CSON010048 protein n=1 Tax=Culicoides sonorensis TaxID=179676 RepID=A0A336MYK3_CULSO
MSPKTKSVILDVDVGTDDAWAILLLLNNELKCNFKIRAITCVFGNSSVENIGKNVLRVLDTVNRLDIPVYLGCNEPLIIHNPDDRNVSFHGVDGLCDIKYESEPDTSIIRKCNAIEAMCEILKENENVTIICLGPLTNLALLMKLHPITRDKINDIYIMGGNRHGVGNITRAAEFNFYCDPEAAFIVFQSAKCQIKLLPLETVRNSDKIPISWRFNELTRNINNKITQLLDPIEKKAYKNWNYWSPFDTFCAAYFIDPTIARKTEDFHMTIELNGLFTRGQVVIDHLDQQTYKNVTVIEEIDVEKFKMLIEDTVKQVS